MLCSRLFYYKFPLICSCVVLMLNLIIIIAIKKKTVQPMSPTGHKYIYIYIFFFFFPSVFFFDLDIFLLSFQFGRFFLHCSKFTSSDQSDHTSHFQGHLWGIIKAFLNDFLGLFLTQGSLSSPCVLGRCYIYWLLYSVRLFALLGAGNAHITKSWGKNVFGLAQNATFWKKLCFGLRQKTRSKHAKFMDCRRSINQNAHARFPLLPLGWWFITKIPIKINQFSHAWSLMPSSHLSALPLHKAPLTPPISSIIQTQTQKHSLKINQITTIKAKKFLLS